MSDPTDADREMAREWCERVYFTDGIDWSNVVEASLATLIAKARAEEREKCARIAGHKVSGAYGGLPVPRFRDGELVAAAIRESANV